jgi:CRP/FNR family transcriptional regulator, cyclic AMP receptor protein
MREDQHPARPLIHRKRAAMSDTTFDVEAIAAAESKVLVLGDGASIYRRHERGDCAYIIRRGQVEISERGRAVEIMQPGEIFGEMALIDNEPRTTSAVALGEAEVIPIDRALFAVLIRDDPDFALTIINLLARRLRAAMNLLEHQGDRPARREAADTRATA